MYAKAAPRNLCRDNVSQRFNAAKEHSIIDAEKDHGALLCRTPIKWMLSPHYVVHKVKSLDDVMGCSGMATGDADFFLMDVILNHEEMLRSTTDVPRNLDDVVMVTANHDPENLKPSCDLKYCTLVAFPPGAGVFYCARERRPEAVGRRDLWSPTMSAGFALRKTQRDRKSTRLNSSHVD